MNRSSYFNYIEEKLNFIVFRIKERGKLNILDLNIYAENFFAGLCNIIFDFELQNLNYINQNIEGIDLIDENNKILIQVSSNCTKEKIENSLNKKIYLNYRDYSYKFILIGKEVNKSLKKYKFSNPYNIKFNPEEDICDINSLLKEILNLNIKKQIELFEFIKLELGEINNMNIETNLAKVINILSEKLEFNFSSPEIIDFAIEDKIKFNKLENVREFIDEYKIYYYKIDEIYNEFDKEGKNKSYSLLQSFKREYIKLKNAGKDSSTIFYEIINNAIETVLNSSNYDKIAFEELETCIYILVVDAFVRCKIFENPEGYDVIT